MDWGNQDRIKENKSLKYWWHNDLLTGEISLVVIILLFLTAFTGTISSI